MLSKYKITLSKKDALKLVKSTSQKLRELDNSASKIVHQLDNFKEKYIELLSTPIELDTDEIAVLENAYSIVPEEVVKRKILEKATAQLLVKMKKDLAELLEIQLNKNGDIQDDKQHLNRILSDLDALSETIETVIKLPECLSFVPWKGAELVVFGLNESSSKETNSSWTVVKTKYPNQLSYVISKCYYIAEHFVNYATKYQFLEQLGHAANNYDSCDEVGLYRCVIDAAKDNVAQLHENFIQNMNERVGDRRIKMFG